MGSLATTSAVGSLPTGRPRYWIPTGTRRDMFTARDARSRQQAPPRQLARAVRRAERRGLGVTTPRLLLIPGYSELEWVIRPELEGWAEVATFDAPGVGDEAPPDAYDTAAVAERAAVEVDRLGWETCVVAGDEYSIAAAAKFASERRDVV